MKILFKTVVVILALFLELALLSILFPGNGNVSYRRAERDAAFSNYENHSSLEAKAKVQDELRLMRKHEAWKAYPFLGLFVAANGVWIYFYFRGRRQPNT
jgi:hypothetical protein